AYPAPSRARFRVLGCRTSGRGVVVAEGEATAPPAAGPLALAARAVTEVFRNPDLRNLQLASASFVTGEWAYTVAVSVYAYRYGGAAWVGIVGFIRMLPAAFSGPFVGALADRYPRERVLLLARRRPGARVSPRVHAARASRLTQCARGDT